MTEAALPAANSAPSWAQTVRRLVWTRTSASLSSADIAWNAPLMIAITCILGSPHFSPMASANVSRATVSFEM